ncbi:MAG: WYL domain-containing protein [Clostridia bacterium]|nr:WYL domain-containing protein [Clostridia bacterium]
MIFSEVYGAYYNCVAAILSAASERPLDDKDINYFVAKYAFKDSYLNINMSSLKDKWGLLNSEGRAVTKNAPTMPLTTLQLRWLKSVMADKRVSLFEENCQEVLNSLKDVEPLYKDESIVIFDKYADGDDYDDLNYRRNFKAVLAAIHNKKVIEIQYKSISGKLSNLTLSPCKIEYSLKDDKFRLFACVKNKSAVLRMSHILTVSETEGNYCSVITQNSKSVTVALRDDLSGLSRNVLERVMLQFSHYKKTAVKTGENEYEVTIEYDDGDETEVLIQLLSFGPLIKVTAPESFVDMIKNRLRKQLETGMF